MFASRERQIIIATAVVAVLVCLWALLPGGQILSVTFFDVGDGACTIVRTPSGRTLVIDCGTSSWRNPSKVGSRLVATYLQSLGINKLDAVVLTHPHADHLSGLPELLKMEPASVIMDTGVDGDSPEYVLYSKAVESSRARYRRLHYGQSIDMGDGVVVLVVGPTDTSNDDMNDNSLVLRLTYGKASFMLAGDATEDAEEEMLDSEMPLRAEVLQVGHHGSSDSTSPAWIAAVRPRIAIISCSARSRYGFPSRQVTDRLNSFGARTYVTGRCGAVTVTTDGSTINVSTFKSAR